ncbi:macrophage migration inhibitory factor-like [Clytia hemisphaerica]
MPILTIKTNADQTKFERRFFRDLGENIAMHCGIDARNVMIVVLGNQSMYFGCSEAICALASFVITDDLINNEQKSKISTDVFKALLAKGVPSSRTYLTFDRIEKSDIFFNTKRLARPKD